MNLSTSFFPAVSELSMKTNQTTCEPFLFATIAHIDLGNRNSITDALSSETDSGETESGETDSGETDSEGTDSGKTESGGTDWN